jgi:hypothetical protein
VAAALSARRGEFHGILESGPAIDPHQRQLFTPDPDPSDVAASQPLRGHTPQTLRPNATAERLTLGQARRQAEISAQIRAELRAEHDRLSSALQPVHDYLTLREDAATASWDAHRSRDAAEPDHQWVARILGQDITEEHADDLGLDL